MRLGKIKHSFAEIYGLSLKNQLPYRPKLSSQYHCTTKYKYICTCCLLTGLLSCLSRIDLRSLSVRAAASSSCFLSSRPGSTFLFRSSSSQFSGLSKSKARIPVSFSSDHQLQLPRSRYSYSYFSTENSNSIGSPSFTTAASGSTKMKPMQHDNKNNNVRLSGVTQSTLEPDNDNVSKDNEKPFEEKEKSLVKRRLAFVFGYLGTQYNGLQKAIQDAGGNSSTTNSKTTQEKQSSGVVDKVDEEELSDTAKLLKGKKSNEEEDTDIVDSVITIEAVFEDALYKAGMIRESNYGNLEKIGWARCSRTDKGVHAVRNVVSAKCEIQLDDIDENTSHSQILKDRINAALPNDIQLFEVTRVGKSFRPREICGYREYEYLIPLDMLRPIGSPKGDPFDEEVVIGKLQEVLKMYEGTNNFHNFTKLKSRELARKIKSKFQFSSKNHDWKTDGGKRAKYDDKIGMTESQEKPDRFERKEQLYQARLFNRNKELAATQEKDLGEEENNQRRKIQGDITNVMEDGEDAFVKDSKVSHNGNLNGHLTLEVNISDEGDIEDESVNHSIGKQKRNDNGREYLYQNDQGSTRNIASDVSSDGIRYYNTDITLNSLFHILYNRHLEDLEFDRLKEERKKLTLLEDGQNPEKEIDEISFCKRQRISVHDEVDNKLNEQNVSNSTDLDSDLPLSLWDLQKHQGVLKMIRTSLFGCEVRRINYTHEDGEMKQYVAVSFRGQSFLYNQIRLLIGAAMAVALDVLSVTAVEAALKSPYLVHIPLAPAVGLYLRNLNFNRKTKNPILMSHQDLFDMHESNKTEPIFLMSNESFEEANQFEKEHVLRQVIEEWWKEDASAIEGFRNFALRHKMPSDVKSRLEKVYGKWKIKMDLYDKEKAERELRRRTNFVDRMIEKQNEEVEEDGTDRATDSNSNEKEKKKNNDSVKDMYRIILPQRFATDLITHFRMKPGKSVADVQRAIAQRMINNQIPAEWITTDLLKYAEEVGVDILEDEGKKIRLK